MSKENALELLIKSAEAAIAYDRAIQGCANDPDKMSSYCTAQGDDLDTLYFNWIQAARSALIAAKVSPAAANKATEEGELPPCPDLPKETAWFDNDRMHFEFGEPEFRVNYYSFGQMLDYARAYARQAIAADRASRQVANKAEVDLSKLTRWTFDEGMTAAARKDGQWYEVDAVERLLATPPATTGASTAPRPTDDELWDATLRDRDAYHDWADKLADAIAKHFGVDIGEHSNQNLPWDEALQAIENAEPVGASTVLTDERIALNAMSSVLEKIRDYHVNHHVLYEIDAALKVAHEVAAQAGQVATAGLSEEQLDRIARNYFSEQWAVQHAKDAIHDALTEAGAAGQVAVPEGWKLVPVKLNEKMRWDMSGECATHMGKLDAMYEAAISAAPSPAKESK